MRISLSKQRKKRNDLLLSVFFIYMIDPFFIDGISTLHRSIYYIIAIIPVIFKLCRDSKIKGSQNKITLFGIGVLMLLALVLSVGRDSDFAYLVDLIKGLFKVICTVGLFFIWERLTRRNKIKNSFEMVFANGIVVYIISTLLFVFIPSLKEFWVNFIYNDRQPLYIIQDSAYRTRYGLAGWSSFAEAYMVLFGMLAVMIAYTRKEIKNIHFAIYTLVMLLGSFLYGRFAMLVIIAMLICYFTYLIIVKKKIWILRLIIIISALMAIGISILFNYSPETRAVAQWAFEPILNYFERKSFAVNSTEELMDMYKNFNPNASDFIIGSGKWYEPNGLPYGYTDVGFMRNIYFGGLLFALFLYSFDYYIITRFHKTMSKQLYLTIGICLLLILILADLKGSMAIVFLKYALPLLLASEYYHNQRIKGELKNGVFRNT